MASYVGNTPTTDNLSNKSAKVAHHKATVTTQAKQDPVKITTTRANS